MLKLVIPPIACLLWAKYELGSDSTISIPNYQRLSENAILNPHKFPKFLFIHHFYEEFMKVGWWF